MRRILKLLPLMSLALLAGADWLHFRGSDNRAVSTSERTPVALAKDESGVERNVAWKTALPGRGVSSPILVAGKVIVTSASGFNSDRLHVVSIDAKTGAVDWERQFWATGRTQCHPTSSVAANSPSSDGKRIFAFFSSNDLACLDLEGNLLWYRGLTHDFPTAVNDVGMSSSPLVLGDTVVVQVENKGESFAAGLDVETGGTRWQIPRPAEMNWTSPAVLRGEKPGEDLVLLQSPTRLTAHRPHTGQQVWSYDVACSPIPSPVTDGDLVYVPSGGVTALRSHASGQAAEVVWTSNNLAPGNASPVVYRGRVYTINSSGVLVCGDAVTSDVKWKLRLKGQFWATPIAAGDHLYAFNQAGEAQVVYLGDTSGEIVARGDFGEPIFGTPIITDGAIYVRTDGHLWKIAGS